MALQIGHQLRLALDLQEETDICGEEHHHHKHRRCTFDQYPPRSAALCPSHSNIMPVVNRRWIHSSTTDDADGNTDVNRDVDGDSDPNGSWNSSNNNNNVSISSGLDSADMAAAIIQRRWRQYVMKKQFDAIKATRKHRKTSSSVSVSSIIRRQEDISNSMMIGAHVFTELDCVDDSSECCQSRCIDELPVKNSPKELSGTSRYKVVSETILRRGIHRFNRDHKKGILYLQKHGLLGDPPEAISIFLHTQKGLSKAMIGDYLGMGQDFNIEVLNFFASYIDMRDVCHIDEALRLYLSTFRLPGEAQKIDRMMSAFAERYFDVHGERGQFAEADTAYVLAFSIVMLNTDAHNPSVKKRMSLQDFIRNNRGIDAGNDLPVEFLTSIYERIREREIEYVQDQNVVELQAVMKRIGGKIPDIVAPHRYLVRKMALIEVKDLHNKSPKGKHLRVVYLFNDLLLLAKAPKWNSHLLISAEFRKTVSLVGLKVLTIDSHVHPCCFAIHDAHGDRIVVLKAPSINLRTELLRDLAELVDEADEIENEKKANDNIDNSLLKDSPGSTEGLTSQRKEHGSAVNNCGDKRSRFLSSFHDRPANSLKRQSLQPPMIKVDIEEMTYSS